MVGRKKRNIEWNEYLNCLTDTLRRKRKQKIEHTKEVSLRAPKVNDEREKARRETTTTTTREE